MVTCLRPDTRLKISLTKEGQLQKAGLLDGVSTWNAWDDHRHAPIVNGQDRTPLQVMLDWINLLTGNPMEKPGVEIGHYQERKIFWLAGDTDLGKTHLAKITVVLYAILTDSNAAFCVWPDKINAIMDGFSAARNGERYEREHFFQEKNADILVIDDLTLAKWSSFRADKLFSLLEHRRFKPTLITSNYLIDAFNEGVGISRVREDDETTLRTMGDRIKSRLQPTRRVMAQIVLQPEITNDK